MRFTRRRPERAESSIGRGGSSLEALESRALLSGPTLSGIKFYQPTELPPITVQQHTATVSSFHPLSSSPRQLAQLNDDGKLVTGTDRQGDQWSIQVHGPGVVIVTDATPNDGVLDDDIDTITLLGTDINKTFVTGQVVCQSAEVQGGTPDSGYGVFFGGNSLPTPIFDVQLIE